jgi:UDP-N-acetylmuramate: L-alanyl-gamma-D-glutamyl-meso-diaminopimelate ligase
MTSSLDITSVRKIYCIAICGMGMGSLAGLLKAAGYDVSGSDSDVYPPMSDQLRSLGIKLYESYQASNVPHDADLIIIGNAVSKGHVEVEKAAELGIPYLSMADAVAEFFLKEKHSIVIAGTHGKTSTASLAAALLSLAGRDPSFLIGGILQNFDRSWQLGQGKDFVIEGDEYDTAFFDKTPKFIHYRPQSAILNAVEFDHADIYQDLGAVLSAFRQFIDLLAPDSYLFACNDCKHVRDLMSHSKGHVVTFGEHVSSDYRLIDLSFENDLSQIVFECNGERLCLMSPMPGRHNAVNLLGVYGLLVHLGLNHQEIQKGLNSFQGIKRRQEVRGIVNGITVIDDFAHHPTAVSETIAALRMKYPGRKLWVVFEPRSNTSRRKIFQNEFADALSSCDELILSKPFDNGKIAPEDLMDVGKMSEIISRKIPSHIFSDIKSIIGLIVERAKQSDVIAIFSNGGFGGIHNKLLQRLKEQS